MSKDEFVFITGPAGTRQPMIKEVRYSRKFGLPNYGSEGYEVSSDLDGSVSPTAQMFILRAFVFKSNGQMDLARSYLAAAYEAQGTWEPAAGWIKLTADELIHNAKEDMGLNG